MPAYTELVADIQDALDLIKVETTSNGENNYHSNKVLSAATSDLLRGISNLEQQYDSGWQGYDIIKRLELIAEALVRRTPIEEYLNGQKWQFTKTSAKAVSGAIIRENQKGAINGRQMRVLADKLYKRLGSRQAFDGVDHLYSFIARANSRNIHSKSEAYTRATKLRDLLPQQNEQG